ncbi:phytanoyl-CoA dioxygenase family protein [Janthinobacterium sp. LB3P118]|uniref:phytanoyl-CoA dioxygenase family protein n=1 Tax=Janthinobacterium sp. LB3P118 TaxID=3424195 RepID=UPI003F2127F3
MKKISAPTTAILDQLSGPVFNPDIFRKAGVFIMRNAIPADAIEQWQASWLEFQATQLKESRDINQANPVALSEQLPPPLATMYRHPVFVDTMRQVLGEHIALYNHRFVIKDRFSTGKVFLHQDSCYHVGNLNKCSLFVPLSNANRDNGGMTFHVGSHQLGFLGDAGEINPTKFDMQWPTVTPELQPGDFVVMHSSLWHESGPNVSGIDRILADTIVQAADDPTGKELLCGQWQTDIFYSPVNYIRYFVNSRVLKIIKYEKERAETLRTGQ